MEEPRRKRIRLSEFDYSSNGAYFVTVCTHNKEKLFGEVGQNSPAYQMVCRVFEEVLHHYPQVSCPKYAVMPNHVHALVVISKMTADPTETLMEMMQAFKSKSTVEFIRLVKAGLAPPFVKKVWQRSYYDHVIRNEADYREVWRYIDENPLKWQLRRMEAEK